MDEDCNQSGPSSKRRKSNNDEPVERAVAVPNHEPVPSIFKLDADCFEEIFDYLSLEDLSSIGQTCKRMQKIAGYCFKQNYGAVKASFEENDSIFVNDVEVNCFVESIKKVAIDNTSFSDEENETGNHGNDKPLNFINLSKISKSIKEIEFRFVDLTETKIKNLKEILGKVECVRIISKQNNDNLLDVMLALCLNLKSLCIVEMNFLRMDQPQWLKRHYPKLENIELVSWKREKIPLKTFFQINTGIKRLAITDELLWFNRQLIRSTGLKFDILSIQRHNICSNFDTFCHLLNKLYEENEFYNKLHFYFPWRFDQNTIDQLAKLKQLVKLSARADNLNFSALVNLEELCINESGGISDLKSLPINLINLKRIQFDQASSDDIFPFIQQGVKMNKIKVLKLLNGTHFCEETNILNLSALNKEREKLTDAKKITIYVDEKVYLATKWSMKQTEYTLIEMKRNDSYDWQYEFLA